MNLPARQRLDKWLWFARVVKSRTLAAKLVGEGFVRVNGVKTDVPAKAVNVGDVLTIALERDVRVLKVMAPGTRRGPFPEAQTLYEDLSPPAEAAAPKDEHAARQPGSGRPTKKERRDRDSFFDDQ
ncbi:RNA-binding S4 domain-containing protein [Roseiarcaceae bacterium H3SJ34-1]|uniref:RNA-binding S4 domain-containing protein n=1 Tax=Terripilifer ovatus TaxID=3032367 RepID=UPI003AB94115|nr:RNA-binding S4 domain-containing protein [Roseiarcaceae bacterium H3SJ34-1]